MTESTKTNLLVLSRSLQKGGGGIVTYVESEFAALSDCIEATHLSVGSRPGEGLFMTFWRRASDPSRLRQLLNGHNIDVIQINSSMNWRSLIRDFFLARIAIRWNAGATLLVFHGWDSSIANRIGSNSLFRRLFLNSFGAAGRIIVLAKLFEKDAIEIGVDPKKMRILPTMFDDEKLGEFRVAQKKQSQKILFMSRMDYQKGVIELARAFIDNYEQYFNGWHLTLAGTGPALDDVKAIARDHENVEVPGFVAGDEKLRKLQESSIFALPTTYNEGIPIAIMEAMSASCAILTTNAGGIGEVLEDGIHGVLLDATDPESICGGLRRLIEDTEFLHKVQSTCHHYAWERFSATSVFAELESEILKLCD